MASLTVNGVSIAYDDIASGRGKSEDAAPDDATHTQL